MIMPQEGKLKQKSWIVIIFSFYFRKGEMDGSYKHFILQ